MLKSSQSYQLKEEFASFKVETVCYVAFISRN